MADPIIVQFKQISDTLTNALSDLKDTQIQIVNINDTDADDGDLILRSGNLFYVLHADTSINSGTPTVKTKWRGTTPLLQGPSILSSSDFVIYDNGYFNAFKVKSKDIGILDKFRLFIQDSRQVLSLDPKINIGLYSSSGTLIESTGIITESIDQHEEKVYSLQNPVTLEGDTDYWIGIYGYGVDIVSYTGFANLSDTFPDEVHCIEDSNAIALPSSINTDPPFSTSTTMAAISGYGR